MSARRQHTLVLIAGVAFAFAIGTTVAWTPFPAEAQQGSPARWTPRQAKTVAPFVGDQVCAQCHKKQVNTYTHSPMRMAMEPVADSRVLTGNPALSFRNGSYSYSIKRQAKQSIYTISDGKENLTLPILYAFGQGKAGQTYVFEYQGELYESLVSYYQEIRALDFTVGASHKVPASLKEAAGRRLSDDEVKNCFGCHATGVLAGDKINVEKLVPGVGCEACHGPGGAHVAAIQSGESGSVSLIFNPKRLSSDELSQEFCAACHRGASDLDKLRDLQINNVRFQPYRIFYSKCYSDDRRISCTSCHNPHEPLKEDAAHYDSKCLACHNTSANTTKAVASDTEPAAPACKVATKDCASCHMPKADPPQAHFKFTDHYIRVVKPGEKYPN